MSARGGSLRSIAVLLALLQVYACVSIPVERARSARVAGIDRGDARSGRQCEDSDADGALMGVLIGGSPILLAFLLSDDSSPDGGTGLYLAALGAVGAIVGFWAGLAVDSARCDGERRGTLAIVTDRDTVVLRKEGSGRGAYLTGTMEFAFTNPLEHPVHVPGCQRPSPPVLEKWIDGEWVLAYANPIALCLTIPPYEIGPGETVRHEYRFFDDLSSRIGFRRLPVEEIPGTYRMVWEVFGEVDEGVARDPIPLEHRISNVFTIELEDAVLQNLEPR